MEQSFTSQCLDKSNSVIMAHKARLAETLISETASSSSSAVPHSVKPHFPSFYDKDLNYPSAQTSLEGIAGDKDVWICDICSQLNPGLQPLCILCRRDRETALSWIENAELSFNDIDPFASSKFATSVIASYASSVPIAEVTVSPSEMETSSDSIVVKRDDDAVEVEPESSPRGILPVGRVQTIMAGSPPEGALEISDGSIGINSPAGASPESSCHQSDVDNTDKENLAPVVLATATKKRRADVISGNIFAETVTANKKPATIASTAVSLTCPHSDCAEVFTEEFELEEHTLSSHKWADHEMIEDAEGNQKFICKFPDCNKEASDKKIIRKHMLSHREKIFMCHHRSCRAKFYERAKLKRHYLVHTGEKPFVCTYDDCGKRFAYNSNLKTHCRTHSGSRPYSCTISGCKRRFAQASNRNSHVVTHQKHVETKVAKARAVAVKAGHMTRAKVFAEPSSA